MRTFMDFKNLDCNAEITRIERAFGLTGDFELRTASGRAELFDRLKHRHAILLPEGYYLWMEYYESVVTLRIKESPKHSAFDGSGEVSYNGLKVRVSHWRSDAMMILARGMFHLGWFDPLVETEMNLAVSAHEKLEWALEYRQRYGL